MQTPRQAIPTPAKDAAPKTLTAWERELAAVLIEIARNPRGDAGGRAQPTPDGPVADRA